MGTADRNSEQPDICTLPTYKLTIGLENMMKCIAPVMDTVSTSKNTGNKSKNKQMGSN